MLTVGISYYPNDDVLFSGKNQTALLLAELFSKHLGCRVTLVNVRSSDRMWWDNFPVLEGVETVTLLHASTFDYFVDVDGLVHPDDRRKVTTRPIAFLRTFVQFTEMDNSVYYENAYLPRYFDQLHEVWCWDILNPRETLDSIQTMFTCPLKSVPFVWSPRAVEHLMKPIMLTAEPVTQWSVHVAEKNLENTSSSIIPLVAIRELVSKKVLSANYHIHNMDRIRENKFLKENVLDNIQFSTLPAEFAKKEHYHEWNPLGNILFSHSRFTPLRLSLLQALWLGIPVIHNSPVLKELHPVLENMFYFGNEIGGICQAFMHFSCNYTTFYQSLSEIRAAIQARWGMTARLEEWKNVLSSSSPAQRRVTFHVEPEIKIGIPEVLVAFSDMWPGFNYDTNFIMDALRHETKKRRIDTVFKGVRYSAEVTPHLVICGPYSTDWKAIPSSIPKVYFTAENWPIPEDPSIALYLTSSRQEDKKHLRIPTWMTFIDWFSHSTELPTNQEDNPIRIPVHFAMTPHPVPFSSRNEFCAFVVSNPICEFRNNTFQAVHTYKHVNSGGQLFNTIGGQLALKYPGGGCGDISKHLFFANHRFTISFENSQAPGYITEKVLHAKMAGCVPLYWGDKDTDGDFVPGSIVNLSHLSKPDQVVTILKKLEKNPALCSKIASTPILDYDRKQRALQMMSEMCKRILNLLPSTSSTTVVVSQENKKPHRIDHVYAINLDTRPDRWQNLLASEPYLEGVVERVPGVNGKTLQLNQFAYDLFRHNEFKWKKSIMGCNLGHFSAWNRVLSEEGSYFLILEDDVRFQKGWLEEWKKYADHIPEDADLLYLGGVLPPNKPMLPHALEAVNSFWSKIKPTTFFSPIPLPVFHFCAYSYILTKSGAKKVLDYMKYSERKYFTVSDHILGHPAVGLTKYIATPLLSYCFQEEDPNYLQSQFNDIHRKDTYDSDIWNNTECFSESDLEPFHQAVAPSIDVYYLRVNDDPFELYEQSWLEDMFQRKLVMKPLVGWDVMVPNDSWVLVQRPHSAAWNQYLQTLQANNIHVKVLHVSDEFGTDNIEFYQQPNCKAVIRNYPRQDTPDLPHIVTIPLGYHHKASLEQSAKSFDDRKLVWSFHGTNWFGREELLTPWTPMMPNNCILTPGWNHPSMVKERDYLQMLSNSKFVPILRGNNPETFRLYEALEAGCIPVSVVQEQNLLFYSWISKYIPVPLCTKENAVSFVQQLVQHPDHEGYRTQLLKAWSVYKQYIQGMVQPLL
jgi:GR25 family glycosyltransferase involved in LPS biosynthesis